MAKLWLRVWCFVFFDSRCSYATATGRRRKTACDARYVASAAAAGGGGDGDGADGGCGAGEKLMATTTRATIALAFGARPSAGITLPRGAVYRCRLSFTTWQTARLRLTTSQHTHRVK